MSMSPTNTDVYSSFVSSSTLPTAPDTTSLDHLSITDFFTFHDATTYLKMVHTSMKGLNLAVIVNCYCIIALITASPTIDHKGREESGDQFIYCMPSLKFYYYCICHFTQF